MGVGDQVPPAIAQLGAQVELLDADALAWGNLGQYDAIVTGVRAYERRRRPRANNRRLLDYAENGGTLIVQYNKTEFNEAQYGPFPREGQFGPRHRRDRAGRGARSRRIRSSTFPNKIGDATWKDWVQERGLYFLGEKDARYVDLVQLQDPFPANTGMKRGALVEAKVGKGRWIYVGLGLWRQLPAGTDGAYQLLANLISVGKAPARGEVVADSPDVLVVGAGPAGTTAARALARRRSPRAPARSRPVPTQQAVRRRDHHARARSGSRTCRPRSNGSTTHYISRLYLEGPRAVASVLTSPTPAVVAVRRMEFDWRWRSCAVESGAELVEDAWVSTGRRRRRRRAGRDARRARVRGRTTWWPPTASTASWRAGSASSRLGRAAVALDMMEESPDDAAARRSRPTRCGCRMGRAAPTATATSSRSATTPTSASAACSRTSATRVALPPYEMQQQFVAELRRRGLVDGAVEPRGFHALPSPGRRSDSADRARPRSRRGRRGRIRQCLHGRGDLLRDGVGRAGRPRDPGRRGASTIRGGERRRRAVRARMARRDRRGAAGLGADPEVPVPRLRAHRRRGGRRGRAPRGGRR